MTCRHRSGDNGGMTFLPEKGPLMTKVLVVDDNEGFRFVFTEMIKFRIPQAEVVEADDGAQGLEVLEKYDYGFDAIVTDFQMPGMDGESFAKNLRFVDKKIPVFLISGWTEGIKNVGLFTGIFDKGEIGSLIEEIRHLKGAA